MVNTKKLYRIQQRPNRACELCRLSVISKGIFRSWKNHRSWTGRSAAIPITMIIRSPDEADTGVARSQRFQHHSQYIRSSWLFVKDFFCWSYDKYTWIALWQLLWKQMEKLLNIIAIFDPVQPVFFKNRRSSAQVFSSSAHWKSGKNSDFQKIQKPVTIAITGFVGGEGGIRTHVPGTDNRISSAARYDHFDTSPYELRWPNLNYWFSEH